MKVLVLGGTGFLGSYLVPALVSRNHDVTVLTRRKSELSNLEQSGVSGVVGDLLEPEKFMSSIPPQDVVVSIAMPIEFGRISGKAFKIMRDRATKFVDTTFTLGMRLDCPVILTLGTAYNTAPGEVADESWPLDRRGIAKIGEDADVLIQNAIYGGQPIIQMLPGQIYGPGGQFMTMYQMMMSGRFGYVGDGSNYVPRVHVEDCASAFVLAIEKLPIGEKYILADDTPCTYREFSEFMASCAEMKSPRKIPRFAARLILGKLILETMEMNCIVSNAKAKRELDWELKFPSYQEGLADTIRRIREESLGVD